MQMLLAETKLTKKEIDRCKNFFALGMLYWLYDRPMKVTLDWIDMQIQEESGSWRRRIRIR